MTTPGHGAATRAELEDFLFRDAALLDAWDLDAWLAQFAPDARYVVPALDVPDGDPATSLFLVNDDVDDLRVRVQHLRDGRVLSDLPIAQDIAGRHLPSVARSAS